MTPRNRSLLLELIGSSEVEPFNEEADLFTQEDQMTNEEIEDLKYVLGIIEQWRDSCSAGDRKRHYTTTADYLRKAISQQWTWPKNLRQYKYLSFDLKGNSRAWTEKPNLVHVGNDLVFCGPSYVFVDVEPPFQAVLPALIANPELVEDIP